MYQIQTVYIFKGLDEHVQIENARKKAKEHPHGLCNVCYHKSDISHNDKCFTLDINESEEDGGDNDEK